MNCSKCDPDVKARYGQKHIHYAAGFGHLNIVKYLVNEKGYDPSTPSETYCTPLYMAAGRHHMNVTEYLVSKQCDMLFYDNAGMQTTYIHRAVLEDQCDTVRFFVKELKCDPNIAEKCGHTPLMDAAKAGNLEMVKFLIEVMGCDPLTDTNRLLLHVAVEAGHLCVVKYLLEEKNCDKNIVDNNGMEVMHKAAFHGHLLVLKYLIDEQKVDKNSKTCKKGLLTALSLAAMKGHLDIVKYFIEEKNYNPNTIDKNNGNTLMHCAALHGHLKVISYLKNIVPNQHLARNKWNGTPIHMAIQNGHIYRSIEILCSRV